MPELPEVETIKNHLEKNIGFARIQNVKIYNNRFRKTIPDDFAANIVNADICSYRRIGKYLVIGLDNKKSIIWHLGMSGKIKLLGVRPEKLEKHDHAVIETSKGVLVFNDARRFGMLDFVKTKDLGSVSYFEKMGIDPFDESLDADYLFGRIKSKRIPIKVLLLDQNIINGIGNIYASEALYKAKISPLRLGIDITKKECGPLIKAIREILEKAIKAGGSTLKDYEKPDGSMGYFQNLHCVYGKNGQQCPDCTCDIKKTGGIKKIGQAGRSTFYCPVKQK